jgi:PAS domain S-box-containing protein
LLSRAVEQTADSVVITDPAGVIQYVNSAFEATTGYSRSEALGRRPSILKSGHHEDAFYRELWTRILQGKPFRGTLVNRKKDGSLYWAEQTISAVRDDEGGITHFVSVLKDITELKKREEHEAQARLAREVQQYLYPTATSLPGMEVAAVSEPAYDTGGDYVDFIPGPDGSLYVGIGDVSGHGSGPALIMALTHAYVRSLAGMGLGVNEVLVRTNQLLASDLGHGRFVTLLLLKVDVRELSLSYASAGHVPGFVLARSGAVEAVLESTGMPLGLFPDLRITATTMPLTPRATVLLLTDGVTEMPGPDGSELGTERVLEFMRAQCDRSARQTVEGLCLAARQFGGGAGQQDDVTAIVIKIHSSCTAQSDGHHCARGPDE